MTTPLVVPKPWTERLGLTRIEPARLAAVTFLAASTLVALWAMRSMLLINDETVHGRQLQMFGQGNFHTLDALTTIPGYHAVLGVLCLASGVGTVAGARTVSFLMSVPATLVFYLLSRRLNPRQELAATFQFHFTPILFPYFFLLYTDGFALFLVLLSVYFVVRRWTHAAAGVAILSVLVRQNNIIWLLFAAALSYYLDNGWTVSQEKVRAFLRGHFPFALALVGFAVFVVLNHGVAIGDRQAHPAMKFGPGNVYLFLFLYFVLSLPISLAASRDALRWCLADKRVLAASLGLFALMMLTYRNDHPYNQLKGIVAHLVTWDGVKVGGLPFLRNELLVAAQRSLLVRAAFFAPVVLSILILARTKLTAPGFWLVLPCAVLYLAPSWLIEHRYAFVPLALLLLVRERRSPALELATAAFGVAATAGVMLGIHGLVFFL